MNILEVNRKKSYSEKQRALLQLYGRVKLFGLIVSRAKLVSLKNGGGKELQIGTQTAPKPENYF